MPFSLKFGWNNQENASAIKSAKGKTGEKAVFSRAVEMKQPRTMTEPFILQYAENIDFSSISH